MRAVRGAPSPSRTSTLPSSSRATRRGSRLKKARSSGRIWAVCAEVCDLRIKTNFNRVAGLDRFRLRVSCSGDVGGRVVKGLAGFVGKLLMLGSDLADRVVPAVVPTDASLSIDQGPSSMRRAKRLLGFSVGVEGNEERASIALADFPLPDKVTSTGHHFTGCRIPELDTSDVGGCKLLLATVLV